MSLQPAASPFLIPRRLLLRGGVLGVLPCPSAEGSADPERFLFTERDMELGSELS